MHPDIWPLGANSNTNIEPHDLSEFQFSAIMQLHDSMDWGLDMQVMLDVLRSHDGKLMTVGERQAVPIYFSNSDMVWKAAYPHNRFAQGAFRHAFKSLYKELTRDSLEFTTFGKPTKETYAYASQMLNLDPLDSKQRVYMVGDNPASDIVGANQAGWQSILVKTGVWKGEPDHSAKYVFDDVLEAVKFVLDHN